MIYKLYIIRYIVIVSYSVVLYDSHFVEENVR